MFSLKEDKRNNHLLWLLLTVTTIWDKTTPVQLTPNTNILPTEFEVHNVSYRPGFFSPSRLDHKSKWEKMRIRNLQEQTMKTRLVRNLLYLCCVSQVWDWLLFMCSGFSRIQPAKLTNHSVRSNWTC